jgi:hypothetical protein
VVYVDLEQADAFLIDVEAAFTTLPKPVPTSGFGGTIQPLKPKSIQQLVDELEMAVQPHR